MVQTYVESSSESVEVSSSGSLLGGSGDDDISVSGNDNLVLSGSSGDDFIDISASSSDSLLGSSGDDVISVSGSDNLVLSGSSGDDVGFAYNVDSFSTLNSSLSVSGVLGADTIGGSTFSLDQTAAILDLDVSASVGSIAGAGDIHLADGVTLRVGGNDNNTVFTGVISQDDPVNGMGSNLIKQGDGTLTFSLTQPHDYAGTTTIEAGRIELIGSETSIGFGEIAFNANSSLHIEGDAAVSFDGFTQSIEAINGDGVVELENSMLNIGSGDFSGNLLMLADSVSSIKLAKVSSPCPAIVPVLTL